MLVPLPETRKNELSKSFTYGIVIGACAVIAGLVGAVLAFAYL